MENALLAASSPAGSAGGAVVCVQARSELIAEGYRLEQGAQRFMVIPRSFLRRMARGKLMGIRFLEEMGRHTERRERRAVTELNAARARMLQ